MIRKIIICLCFITTESVSFAHPPKEISVIYNPISEEITIFIEHYSSDPQVHYVEIISVLDESGILFMESFLSQTSNKGQICKKTLKGKKQGDIVKVYCKCKKFGKKTKIVTL